MNTEVNDFAEIEAEWEQKQAAGRAIAKMANELWQNMLKLYGKQEARQRWCGVAGVKKVPGRKPLHDALDDYIDWLITVMMCDRGTKTFKHGDQKSLLQRIQKRLKYSPLTERRFRETPGPNAGFYIDPNTGEEDFDPDVELEPEVVLRNVEDEKLRDRIKKGIKRYKARQRAS